VHHDRIATMPTRNVNSTEAFDRFVRAKVESGRYENASEVVRAALRSLEREEQRPKRSWPHCEPPLMKATSAALPKVTRLNASGKSSTRRVTLSREAIPPFPSG
jgi:putative addiction module CopG family antidote